MERLKCRRKGSNNPFTNIAKIQLEGSDILFNEDVLEFKHDSFSTELKTYSQIEEDKYWCDLKNKAAIAALQGVLSNTNTKGDTHSVEFREDIAKFAIECADALILQLKT